MSTVHERFIGRALELARRGLGSVSPNPMVGAVVVRGKVVVGEGYHQRAGGPHAEIVALRMAGRRAQGSTLYVNLEPCSHHGRTPPCTEEIIRSGVATVVVGMIDPNPLVCGKGIEALRQAGIRVIIDTLKERCEQLNQIFSHYISTRRPFVTLKMAATLDGRVAAGVGTSANGKGTRGRGGEQISGDQALKMTHKLRHEADCIVVGSGTVLADDPQLNCRGIRRGRDPLRVILDSQLRTPKNARAIELARSSSAETWVIASHKAPISRARRLERAGARVWRTATTSNGISIAALLKLLARHEVTSVLLEGGPTLAGSFWRARRVDRLVAMIAPRVLGDPHALPMIMGPAVTSVAKARSLDQVVYRRVGEDMMVDGRVVW